MPVIRSADAAAHTMHGARFTSYANAATGSRELRVWRADIPAGTPALPHRISREEVFVLVSGCVELTLDGARSRLEPGDAAVAPAGTVVSVANPGPEAAAAWVSTTCGLEAELEDGTRVSPPWAQ